MINWKKVCFINAGISNMQEQSNDWSDSIEKLVMEAEVQNKMIASLVNYAQQQQSGKKK